MDTESYEVDTNLDGVKSNYIREDLMPKKFKIFMWRVVS